MAEHRAYSAVVATVERKAKELTECVSNNSVARVVKIKQDKLLSDIDELKKLGDIYIATIKSTEKVDKIYSEQSVLLDRANQALEGASEFLELEAFNISLLEKTQEVEAHCCTVDKKVTSFQTRLNSLQDRSSALSKGSYDVLIAELSLLDNLVGNKADEIKFLIVNDRALKSKYEGFQSKLDGYLEPLLDMRLQLVALFENQSVNDSNKIK